jgi:glycosyltransferase involved in cell wall biosynthesis
MAKQRTVGLKSSLANCAIPKKICQIGTTINRYDSRILYKQSCSLVRAGFDVTVICSDNLPSELNEGVKIVPLGFVPKNRFQRFIRLKKPLFKAALAIGADIYQINGTENLPVALKLKKLGKKVVFDSREDYPALISEKKWIPFYFRKIVSIIYSKYEKIVLTELDAVLAVTTFLYNRLKKVNSNVHIVTNYPIVNRDIVLAENPIPEKAVCFVGTMSTDDMHENVIRALSMIKETRYLIAVVEESKYTEKLKTLCKSLSIEDRIEIVKNMPKSELPKFHSRALAGIAIRKYAANYGYKEGSLGVIKFFEYLSSGLPVICTDFKVWKEIISDYKCGICVNPYDVHEISEAIKFISEKPEETKQMGENARRAALEKYNWASQEKIYIDVYSNL